MLAELKKNIDLVSVVESSGVELARRGTRPCPLVRLYERLNGISRERHSPVWGNG